MPCFAVVASSPLLHAPHPSWPPFTLPVQASSTAHLITEVSLIHLSPPTSHCFIKPPLTAPRSPLTPLAAPSQPSRRLGPLGPTWLPVPHLAAAQATKKGRVDMLVQSTDKNFLVPVGGAILASNDKVEPGPGG